MARLEPAGNPQLRAVAGFRDEEASDLSSAHVTGRLIALGLVILLHALMIYGLANLLSRRRVEVPSLAVTARIIAAVAPERPVAGPADTPVAPAPEVAQPPALKPAAAPVRAPPRASRAAPTHPAEDAAPQPAIIARPPAATALPTPELERTAPRIDLAHSREPLYPAISRRLGEQGSLVLEVLVDREGRVVQTRLLQSSGFARLDRAALEGVESGYHFVPGTIGGAPHLCGTASNSPGSCNEVLRLANAFCGGAVRTLGEPMPRGAGAAGNFHFAVGAGPNTGSRRAGGG